MVEANKLDRLCERGIVLERDKIQWFSDLVFAEGMRQIHPDRVFLDVGTTERAGYVQATEADAARLEAEGYRLLTIHPKELALLSDARRAAGYGIRWGSMMTPMHSLLPLAARAGVVAEGTEAFELLGTDSGRRVRLGGSKRIMFDQLVGMAKLWTYASRRLEPEYGWGAADALPEDARTALDKWADSQIIEYVNAQQKTLGGALRLALALSDQERENTKKAALANKQFGEATDDRIKLAAEKYMKTGRNWMAKKDAAVEVARDLGKPGKDSYILKRLCAIYPGAAWPPKPRKAATT
jgi:hypothetical protein